MIEFRVVKWRPNMQSGIRKNSFRNQEKTLENNINNESDIVFNSKKANNFKEFF